MNEKIIFDILSQIEGRMLWLLAELIVAWIVILMLKGYVQRIAAYLGFRVNKQFGVKCKVRVHGAEGEIANFDTKWIYVKTNQGMKLIPIENWKKEIWTITE